MKWWSSKDREGELMLIMRLWQGAPLLTMMRSMTYPHQLSPPHHSCPPPHVALPTYSNVGNVGVPEEVEGVNESIPGDKWPVTWTETAWKSYLPVCLHNWCLLLRWTVHCVVLNELRFDFKQHAYARFPHCTCSDDQYGCAWVYSGASMQCVTTSVSENMQQNYM